ncbi:MAG: helix-turn-helix domain-containing protein [Solirubrobacteraceae bacterium]
MQRTTPVDSGSPKPMGGGFADDAKRSPPELEELAASVAVDMLEHITGLAELWTDTMFALPELAEWVHADARPAAIANARADIGRELQGLIEGRRLPVSCPEEIATSARLAVEGGLPLWATLQSYRTGHAVQWAAWRRRVERLALDDAGKSALLTAGSDYFFAYADRSSIWMEQAYSREHDRRLSSHEQRRAHLIGSILAGDDSDTGSLKYELRAWHLGVIVWGAEAEPGLAALAEEADLTLLSLACGRETVWGWLAAPAEPDAACLRAIRQTQPPNRCRLALGEFAYGADGFRRTHEEALDARLIATLRPDPVTHYRDIALEALTSRDQQRAGAFVERELGALADDDDRAATMRSTLLAYFSAAQQATSAAALLGVHERTVTNRLRAIATQLGCSPAARRAELETALRLHRLLQLHSDSVE